MDALTWIGMAVKGGILLAGAGVLTMGMRRAPAARRHLVWTVALMSLPLVTVLSLMGPSWKVPVLETEPAPQTMRAEAAVAAELAMIEAVAADAERAGPAGLPAPPVRTELASIAPSGVAASPRPWRLWMIVGWGLVSALTFLPPCVGLVALRRLRRSGRVPVDDYWTAALEEARHRLRIRRPVLLLEHAAQDMPMTWGVLRPRVMVPMEARNWTAEKQRAVLLHELAHVKRLDYLTRFAARLGLALHGFNPLAWVAWRAMRRESERACDDAVLLAGSDPADYADHLLQIAQRCVGSPWVAASAITMARRSQLEGRILAVLDATRKRAGNGRRRVALALGLATLMVIPLSVLQLTAKESPADPPMRHFVRIVVGLEGIAFEGEPTAWDALPARLAAVPERSHTVLELAVESEGLSMRQWKEALAKAMALREAQGFEYLSDVGVHAMTSRGSASEPRLLSEPELARRRDGSIEQGELIPALQALIDAAAPGAVVVVPNGTYEQPVTIDKALTLRGSNSAFAMLKVTADQPAIHVTTRDPVVIEDLTIKWQRETSQQGEAPPMAVAVQDGKLSVARCQFTALGGDQRSPGGVSFSGFAEGSVVDCVFSGFEYPVQFWGGAKGMVMDCVVVDPGHCGITAGHGSEVTAKRNLVTGSKFHGMRCTGGTIAFEDNLIIANANRGIYLGNRSVTGVVRNNLILGNATGISVFGGSDCAIENNLLIDNGFAAIDARDTCPIEVRDNILQGNAQGFVLWSEGGVDPRVRLQGNTWWGNASNDVLRIDKPAGFVSADPGFADAAAGDFSRPGAGDSHGLVDAGVMQTLWAKWVALGR